MNREKEKVGQEGEKPKERGEGKEQRWKKQDREGGGQRMRRGRVIKVQGKEDNM